MITESLECRHDGCRRPQEPRVVDKTGLTKYDFTMQWECKGCRGLAGRNVPLLAGRGQPDSPSAASEPVGGGLPTIFVVFEKQLGLDLKGKRYSARCSIRRSRRQGADCELKARPPDPSPDREEWDSSATPRSSCSKGQEYSAGCSNRRSRRPGAHGELKATHSLTLGAPIDPVSRPPGRRVSITDSSTVLPSRITFTCTLSPGCFARSA